MGAYPLPFGGKGIGEQYLCLPPSLNHLIKNGWLRLITTVISKQYSSYIMNSDLLQYSINITVRPPLHRSLCTSDFLGEKAEDPDPLFLVSPSTMT
jgi:hypothetical protein